VLGEELGHIKADPGQLESVIMNLAVNAKDAMPDGGKLTVETANVELDQSYASTHMGVNPGPHVVLAISDSGCGMSPEVRGRIFEPFFTTKARGRGTGLGLSTVYGIVKQSGGSIWVYSEEGRGSTFKVYFPRVDEAREVAEARASQVRATGAETVLVVEDEQSLRSMVRTVLEAAGYVVLEANGGHEAIAVCLNHVGPIHLLLTDVVMPQMNGREVSDHIVASHPETRVLYMSGYTDKGIVHNGVLESGAAFLQKPFTPNSLTRKIREVLDRPNA
jgi:CheY-like chemotaxis protein